MASKDEKARMAYEARQAEIIDQMTREKTAREQGLQQGEYNKALEVVKNAYKMKLPIEQIAMLTNFTEDKVKELIAIIEQNKV